ncbi:MAG: hypothetical protein D6775_17220 [Caldilineae bacterium]|nr:MAG: hypothetical protein D6775_17220 [Caldilineae bacterium]
MDMQRPDLSGVDPAVVAYIETLEAELARLRRPRQQRRVPAEQPPAPAEPPTTINLITLSARGLAKRTPRHHYRPQRRGGMGIFDLETPEEDPPRFLALADQEDLLLLITSQARAFIFPVEAVTETPIRSRGMNLAARLGWHDNEHLACVLPVHKRPHLMVVSARGQVRRYGGHTFSTALRPGSVLYDVRQGGPPAAACWVEGDRDLFIATRAGLAIRFAQRLVPVRGCLGIRLQRDDEVVGACEVDDDSGVFLLGADGKGTIRLMEGFRANKSPGGGGKVAMKTDALVGCMTVQPEQDIFILSRLGKIIRFDAAEVPPKSGVVQGVQCMELRADATVAMTHS